MQKSIFEYRCSACRKLLAKGAWNVAQMEIKCLRCGAINSFFDDNEDQILITDQDGIVLYANQALVDSTGYSLQEIIGNTPSLWGGHMPRSFYVDLWQKVKCETKVAMFEITNKKKSGEPYNVILRISPILDINGKPMMFFGIETKVSKNRIVIQEKK